MSLFGKNNFIKSLLCGTTRFSEYLGEDNFGYRSPGEISMLVTVRGKETLDGINLELKQISFKPSTILISPDGQSIYYIYDLPKRESQEYTQNIIDVFKGSGNNFVADFNRERGYKLGTTTIVLFLNNIKIYEQNFSNL